MTAKLVIGAITAVALAVVYILRAVPKKTDKLREKLNALDEEIARKRQRMADAYNGGDLARFRVIHADFQRLCSEARRLRGRLEKS